MSINKQLLVNVNNNFTHQSVSLLVYSSGNFQADNVYRTSEYTLLYEHEST